MSGRFPAKPTPRSQPLNSVSPTLFRRRRLWFKFTTYRPLAVLAGIWIGLLAIAFLAYGQLLHPRLDRISTETAAEVEVYPHERLQAKKTDAATPPAPNAPETTNPPAADIAQPATATSAEPADDVAGLGLGTLFALVGTCALGCWFLSIQLQKPRKPRVKPSKGAKRLAKRRLLHPQAAGPKPTVLPPKPSSPQRLAPYDPNQPLVAASSSRQETVPPQPTPAPASTPADVTVVSTEFQHQLDWPEDSLVNVADVRQRRSLSSYM
jgi:hypothetical protein